MTHKELYTAFAEKFGDTTDAGREKVEYIIDTMISEAMKGSCAFGKTGTFKVAQVSAKPARLNVANPMKPGTSYDVPAKPARTKLTFSLSKQGKLLGA